MSAPASKAAWSFNLHRTRRQRARIGSTSVIRAPVYGKGSTGYEPAQGGGHFAGGGGPMGWADIVTPGPASRRYFFACHVVTA